MTEFNNIKKNLNNESDYLSPYNPKNEFFNKIHFTFIFKKNLGMEIETNNLHLYRRAFTHESYVKPSDITEEQIAIYTHDKERMERNMNKKIVDLQPESYETLEFLGDNVIKLPCANYLYERYGKEDQGFMTYLKTRIEDTKTYSKFCLALGLERYMLISKEHEDKNSRDAKKLHEDIFEAFIGALFLDKGFEICKKLVYMLYDTEICFPMLLHVDCNYKNLILSFYHSNHWSPPKYESVGEEIIDNKTHFIEAILDYKGDILLTASATSKKKAQQRAAGLALLKFGELDENDLKDVDED